MRRSPILLVVLLVTAPAGAAELWAPNYYDGTVSIVDSGSLQLLDTIAVAGPEDGLAGVAFSADGKLAFITGGLGEIHVVDAVSRTALVPIFVSPRSDPLIYTGALGERLFVSDCNGSSVAVIDIATLQQVDEYVLSSAAWRMALESGGSYAYTDSCDSTNGARRIDLIAGVEDRFLPLGLTTLSVALSPDNSILAVGGIGEIVLIDTAGFLEVGHLMDTPNVDAGAFNDTGTRLHGVSFGGGSFVTFDVTDPTAAELLSEVPVDGLPFDLTVAGNRAFLVTFDREEPSTIVAMDLGQVPPAVIGSTVIGNGAFILALRPEPSVADLLQEAVDLVRSLDVPPLIARSLAVKLEHALAAAATTRAHRAARYLHAAAQQVNALRGVWLSAEEANELQELIGAAAGMLIEP